jgi:hypothetical protein
LRLELVFRKIAFDAMPLGAFGIKDDDARGPGRVEAVKPRRVFLDMGFNWDEVRVDEGGDACIRVRLGLQPSTCPSSGGGAEIE